MGRYDEYESDLTYDTKTDELAGKYVEHLGGVANIVEIDNCATRLRLILKDTDKINESELNRYKG